MLDGTSVAITLSPDGRQLFAHENLPQDSEAKGRGASWLGFSLETFKPVSERIVLEPAVDSASVVGSLLLYSVTSDRRELTDEGFLSPRTLKARDAHSGLLLWKRPILGHLEYPPASSISFASPGE
jgi:hypothetical protein